MILLKRDSLCSWKIGAVCPSNVDFVISLTVRFWSIVSLLKFVSYVQSLYYISIIQIRMYKRVLKLKKSFLGKIES